MATVMTNTELTAKCRDIAENYKTLYISGCFGAPMNATNKARYSSNCTYNKGRADMINAASSDTFGFDCVCLIKGILWGWCGDTSATYGGATYKSNGVPDIGTEGIIEKCSGVSTDFSSVEIGELLWMSGHVGVYIGDKLCVECSPKWDNDVQITAVKNIGTVSGYNSRTWTKHGKLPYVDYTAQNATESTETNESAEVSVDTSSAETSTQSDETSTQSDETSTQSDGASLWAKEATDAAKAAGVFVGDENGNMCWQDNITREQTATILCRIGAVSVSSAKTSDDGASAWAVPYTEGCKDAGVFQGDENGDFDWQGMITREQFATVICRAGLVEVWDDAVASGDGASEWAVAYTESCKHAGVFVGDDTGAYNWCEYITREAVAVVLHRVGAY